MTECWLTRFVRCQWVCWLPCFVKWRCWMPCFVRKRRLLSASFLSDDSECAGCPVSSNDCVDCFVTCQMTMTVLTASFVLSTVCVDCFAVVVVFKWLWPWQWQCWLLCFLSDDKDYMGLVVGLLMAGLMLVAGIAVALIVLYRRWGLAESHRLRTGVLLMADFFVC